jgi:methyl-accepting chemotaxis protein
MIRNMKITQRFILAVGLAVLVVFTVNYLVAQYTTTNLFDDLERSALREISNNVLDEIDAESLRAQSMAAVVAAMPSIQQAFAERDRDRLQRELAAGFDGLQSSFGVRQFQFHEPPATSFLRVHKLDKFGDDLSSFRQTVLKANNERTAVRGLEVGVAGLGIRGVVPVSADGEHLGTVEFGLSLGQPFVERVARNAGIDLQVYLRRDGRLQSFASSLGETSLVDIEDLRAIDADQPLFNKLDVNGRALGVYGRVLKDFSGNDIGVVLIAKDRSDFAGQVMTQAVQTIALFVVSALVLLIIVSFIVKGVVSPLRKAKDNMAAIAYGSGDLTDRLDETGADEVAELARAYNAFVAKLEQTINEILRKTRELSGMVGTFSSVSENTSQGTRRQQEQVTQVATAMTEMSATVHEVAQNTADTAEAARRADDQSNHGRAVVEAAMDAINRLADEVGSAAGRIQSVEQDSQRIGSVLDVIRGIAEQTNLLALNAAIEAARAGEQGRGFAVVADEVRTLAQRTQQSTSEIQEMIESLQSGVENTVAVLESSQVKAKESVDQAALAQEALSSINEAVDAITTMSTQIATAAEEQSAVAEDINRSVVDITHVAETTSQEAMQNVRETEHLATVVDDLMTLMSDFRTGNHHLNQIGRAKAAHLTWKGRVRSFLDHGTALDEQTAFSHTACGLGQWLASMASTEIAQLPQVRALEGPHRELHETIRRVTELKRNGDYDGAETAFARIEPLSQQIVDLLDALESVLASDHRGGRGVA